MPPRKEVSPTKSASVKEVEKSITAASSKSVKSKSDDEETPAFKTLEKEEVETPTGKSPTPAEKSPTPAEKSPTPAEKSKSPVRKSRTPLSASVETPRSAKKPVVENNVLPKSNKKYNTKFCDESMTYEQCEMAILRHYVDKNEHLAKIDEMESQDIKNLTKVVEGYLRESRLVCYGGTAINNILPKKYQFYDDEYDVPDYDFYSPAPTTDAKKIADLYAAAGYQEVEAKAGVHPGTVKVFAQGIGIADVTFLEPPLFEKLQKDAIKVDGILYAPADFLRMNMYIELSRPQGHVGRWEKVLKRLNLLNQAFPLKTSACKAAAKNAEDVTKAAQVLRALIVDLKGVFFGGYAASLYAGHTRPKAETADKDDVDAIVEDLDTAAEKAVRALEDADFEDVDAHDVAPVGELIAASKEIRVGGKTVCTLFAPQGCQNYNYTVMDGKNVRVATIDTILCMYLAFYYSDNQAYDKDRIMCTAQQMYNVQKDTKLIQKDILKRFNSSCIGRQPTMTDMKNEKLAKAKEYLTKPKDAEYEKYFFKYTPGKVDSEKPAVREASPAREKESPRFREQEYVPRRPRYKQWHTIRRRYRPAKSRKMSYRGPSASAEQEEEGMNEKSPAKQTKEGSPAKQTREGSPAKQTKEGSPAKQTKEGSPAKQTREGSPATQKRKRKRKKTAKRGSDMRLSFL